MPRQSSVEGLKLHYKPDYSGNLKFTSLIRPVWEATIPFNVQKARHIVFQPRQKSKNIHQSNNWGGGGGGGNPCIGKW